MSYFRHIYEQFRSLIVLLGLVELVWIVYWLIFGEGVTTRYLATVSIWVVGMLGWMTLIAFLGKRGTYIKYTRWFSNLIGLFTVIAFAAILLGIVGREGTLLAVSQVPDQQLIGFHILRLLAIGTIIKYLQGQLPLHFVLLGSIPDFLFAVSAVAISLLPTPGSSFLMIWHIIGIVVFFGPGISMFFSVPSPLRLYHTQPDTSLVFQFPMLLAPNFTVPLFELAHILAIAKLITQG